MLAAGFVSQWLASRPNGGLLDDERGVTGRWPAYRGLRARWQVKKTCFLLTFDGAQQKKLYAYQKAHHPMYMTDRFSGLRA